MSNESSYTRFKQAFLDQVILKGYDGNFIDGFFKRAEEEYARWEALVQATYHGDTALCKQAYAELAYALTSSGLIEKSAEGGEPMGAGLLGLLSQLGDGAGDLAGSLFGQQGGGIGGPGLGGVLAGGSGGLLLGLLLSQALGIPLSTGMLLGTLAGAGLGYGAAGTAAGQQKVFGVNGPPQPELNAAPKPEPTDPAAAAAVTTNQAVADQTAAGQPPPVPQTVQPPPPPTKPVVPPQQPGMASPQPGTATSTIPSLGAPSQPLAPRPPGAK